MNCPTSREWDLLAAEALEDERAESMLAHARTCHACREQVEAARRAHIDRVRMYEAFDRDHDELREQLMATLPAEPPRQSAADRLARGWYRLGDNVMSINKTTGRRATALLVPAACIAVFAFVLLFSSGERSAFAAALERLRTASTIVCTVTMPEGIEIEGIKLYADGKMYLSEEHGCRSEMFMNGMEITRHYARTDAPMIVVQPVTRTWMELDISEIAYLEMHEQSPDAFLRSLFKLTEDSATELGVEEVDGSAAAGYRIPGEKLGLSPSRDPNVPAAFAELWVDIETRLPVLFVLSTPMRGFGTRLVMHYSDFQWDQPLEASLFEPNIPDDYTKIDVKLARPTEEALLNALQRIRDLTGGRYPTTFDSIGVLSELHSLVPKENYAQFDKLGQQGMVQLGMEIAGGSMYYMKLLRDGHEPEYFGDTVTADDADQVLFRWKLDDGSTRLIFGDLRVETLPAE
jgi:hypothetical protein